MGGTNPCFPLYLILHVSVAIPGGHTERLCDRTIVLHMHSHAQRMRKSRSWKRTLGRFYMLFARRYFPFQKTFGDFCYSCLRILSNAFLSAQHRAFALTKKLSLSLRKRDFRATHIFNIMTSFVPLGLVLHFRSCNRRSTRLSMWPQMWTKEKASPERTDIPAWYVQGFMYRRKTLCNPRTWMLLNCIVHILCSNSSNACQVLLLLSIVRQNYCQT